MSESITQLINRWRQGDQNALNEVYPLIEPELRKIARRGLSRGITLQTTVLVDDLLLVLSKYEKELTSREHLYSLCASIVRNAAIDNVRKRSAKIRGGGKFAEPLDEVANELANIVSRGTDQPEQLLLALDEALKELAAADPERAELLNLHFFAGRSYEEIAELKKLTRDQVRGRLRVALSWLRAEIERTKDKFPA